LGLLSVVAAIDLVAHVSVPTVALIAFFVLAVVVPTGPLLLGDGAHERGLSPRLALAGAWPLALLAAGLLEVGPLSSATARTDGYLVGAVVGLSLGPGLLLGLAMLGRERRAGS
jgi:hypothetical protein